MNTAGVWWRWSHPIGVAAFAVLLLFASVVGYHERTRSDSIVNFVDGGGYEFNTLRPDDIVILGGEVRTKDTIVLESVTPISTDGDGRVLDIRASGAGAYCAPGWPMRTHYAKRVAGTRLAADRSHLVGLFLKPRTPRWVVDAVVVRYRRNGERHQQRLDVGWTLETSPGSPGCRLRAEHGWDAPIVADPTEVVCLNAWQARVQVGFTGTPASPKFDDMRRAPGWTYLHTIVTWAPDVDSPALRAAMEPLSHAMTRATPLPANGAIPLLEAAILACRQAGAFAEHPYAMQDP